MSDDFISRWSRRKIEARKGETETAEEVAAVPAAVLPEARAVPEEKPPEPLPPVESLTPESDFTPFMKSEVDPQLKRDALKALFKDPRYNVMDGLDTYIDDYSKPDPLPEGWLEQMTQFARLGDYKPPPDPEPETAPGPAEIEEIISVKQVVDGQMPTHPDGAKGVPSPPSESQPSRPGES
ncbi:MAG: DUF3306 domain-containing protein [Usitatibacter sp.]